MTQEELIKQCKYYKGEDECPNTFADEFDCGLWTAEMMCVTEFGAKNRAEFVSKVLAYVGKWDPYDFGEYLKRYIRHFPDLEKEMNRIYNS